MLNFDANEGYIDRRPRGVDAPAHADFPMLSRQAAMLSRQAAMLSRQAAMLSRQAGMTVYHDRPPGSPS